MMQAGAHPDRSFGAPHRERERGPIWVLDN